MKVLLLILCLTCTAAFAAEPAPTLPETVKLTNGAVLKKISVIRWTSDGVVLKHAGGADPIRFAHIDPSQRALFETLAAEAKKVSRAPVAAAAKPNYNTYSGQAYITTRGAGSYKLSDMTVYVFPEGTEQLFQTNLTVDLPKPLAKAVTDADGKYSFSLPNNIGFFIFAQGRRLAGGNYELYEWRIPSTEIKDPAAIHLRTDNHLDRHVRVKIAD